MNGYPMRAHKVLFMIVCLMLSVGLIVLSMVVLPEPKQMRIVGQIDNIRFVEIDGNAYLLVERGSYAAVK